LLREIAQTGCSFIKQKERKVLWTKRKSKLVKKRTKKL